MKYVTINEGSGSGSESREMLPEDDNTTASPDGTDSDSNKPINPNVLAKYVENFYLYYSYNSNIESYNTKVASY